MTVSIVADRGGLLVRFPYSPDAVKRLKAEIPAHLRRWDPETKCWAVDPSVGAQVATLLYDAFGEQVTVPLAPAPTPTVRLIEARYVGACRDESKRASIYVGGGWNASASETVLRQWFEGGAFEETPVQEQTLFRVLGLPPTEDIPTITTAYRRMVKQWHPDVCREPDASERFQAIQDAYERLRDPKKLKRYLLMLDIEKQIARDERDRKRLAGTYLLQSNEFGYRAPLRCGLILAEGVERIGRFEVLQILSWLDIVNPAGQALVTSWPKGATMFVEEWR